MSRKSRNKGTAADEKTEVSGVNNGAGDQPGAVGDPGESGDVRIDSAPELILDPDPDGDVGSEDAGEVTEDGTAEVIDADPAPVVVPQPVIATSRSNENDLRESLRNVLPDIALRSWPYSALVLYQKTGAYPQKTARGNLQGDIRRGTALREWTSSEIEDWIDGEIKSPDNVDDELVVDEIYRRWKLPNNWTYAAAIEYIRTDVEPATTKDGVLLEDRARATAPVNQWTYLELRAALLGQIDCSHEQSSLVDQLRKRLGLNESFSAAALLDDLNNSPTEVTMDNVLLKAKLDEYRTAMSKGPHLSDQTAGDAQYMLYKIIRAVMQRDPRDFAEGWLIMLNFINEEYNRLFNPDVARRGWSHIPMKGNSLTTFEELLWLMICSRDPRTRRSGVLLANPETVLRYVPNEVERQNVLNFYARA